jgi:hypothetical protein
MVARWTFRNNYNKSNSNDDRLSQDGEEMQRCDRSIANFRSLDKHIVSVKRQLDPLIGIGFSDRPIKT